MHGVAFKHVRSFCTLGVDKVNSSRKLRSIALPVSQYPLVSAALLCRWTAATTSQAVTLASISSRLRAGFRNRLGLSCYNCMGVLCAVCGICALLLRKNTVMSSKCHDHDHPSIPTMNTQTTPKGSREETRHDVLSWYNHINDEISIIVLNSIHGLFWFFWVETCDAKCGLV